MGRTLVGGVGHFHLSDFSIGPALSALLEAQPWPDGVVVEDLSYGPVTVCHRLSDEQPPFARWIIAGAVRRGRAAGTVTAYRWNGILPETEEIQARVAEAVAGVIGLDSLVIIAAAFGAAPRETCVVEVEPLVEAFGETLSPAVACALDEAAARVRRIAIGQEPALPVAALGG